MIHYLNIIYFSLVTLIVFSITQNKIVPIANKFNLLDKDPKTKNTPLFGGVFLALGLLIIYTILLFTTNKNYFLSESIYIFLIFFIGAYDDSKNLNPLIRLILSSIIVLLIINHNQLLIINFLYIDKFYIFNSFTAIFFTILCFLLFQNALNLMDGINCLVISYCIFILIILTILDQSNFEIKIILIIVSFYILILNYNNITFLGDSGVYILSFIISVLIIETYKLNYKTFSPVDILMLFSFAGYDMFRLFIQRILKKKHPFSKDKNHLHHYLNYKIKNLFIISFIYIFSSLILFAFSYFLNLNYLLSIFLSITLYLTILFYAKNNYRN